MKTISNQEFGGERPLYAEHDLQLDHVTIHVGESSLKETSNIHATNCRFEGKYVFWECCGFSATNCLFAESARSSLWYCQDGTLTNCCVEAPKMFRRMKGIRVKGTTFGNALETLWDCDDVEMENVEINNADYLGMHTHNVRLTNYRQDGNYSWQYSKNMEIRNAVLNSKDALWEAENVSVFDSEINGEYLAWYSKNLRLVRCHITGQQPLCYCENLVLEDCTFGDDAVLALEYSTVEATIRGDMPSIKNPTSGHIRVEGKIGEIILDKNQKRPADAVIEQGNLTNTQTSI